METVQEVIESTQTQEIFTRIDALSDKIGQSAPIVYETLINEYRTRCIVEACLSVGMLATIFVAALMLFMSIRKSLTLPNDKYDTWPIEKSCGVIISSGVIILLLLFGSILVVDLKTEVSKAASPNISAIQQLIGK